MKDGAIVQVGTPAELVSNPANDYVAEFTRDVPKLKILTAGAILSEVDPQKISAPLEGNPTIENTTTIDQFLPILIRSETLNVANHAGDYLGSISVLDVLKKLAEETTS